MTRPRCSGRRARLFPALLLALAWGLLLAGGPARAAETADKIAGLGLSFTQAAAESKSVTDAAKSVVKDEASDWLLTQLGGLEALKGLKDYGPVYDKVTEFTGLIDTVQSVATQLGAGNYDQAAIEMADAAVGKLNNPAVSAVWAAAKAAYESHLLVQSTGAARDIEALYGTVERDRRLIGAITPDSPAQISITSDTVDYFFNDYIVTNEAVRGLVKSYVTTHLGEEWPEQSWASYLASLGMTSAQDEETLALTGELRNTARGWIRTLLADVNKQARVRYQEARLRQENARFEEFVAKMKAFTGNDLPRLLQLYTAAKAAREELPRYRALLEGSRSEMARISAALDKPALINLPAYQQTGTRMIRELNQAAARAYMADAFDLHSELESESGRWSVLLRNLQVDAPTIHAQELTEYEKKLAKMDEQARAHNAELARTSTATDGAGRPWGSQYDQHLADYQDVKAYIKRYPIESATARMAEVEAQVLDAYNVGDSGGAQALQEQAVAELGAEINAFYDEALEVVRKAQPDNSQRSAVEGDMRKWRDNDLATVKALSDELSEKGRGFYDLTAYWSGRAERYNRFMASIATPLEMAPDKFWERPAPTYELEMHTAVGTFGDGSSMDLQEVVHRLRMAASSLSSQLVSDGGLEALAAPIDQADQFVAWLKKRLEERKNERDQVFTDEDMDYIEALLGPQTATRFRERERALEEILDRARSVAAAWRVNLAGYARRARTNNSNLEQDIAFLGAKHKEMEEFLRTLRGGDQILRMDQEGRLLPFAVSGPGGEALALEPYPHYMDAAQLREYGQDWLKRLQAYPQWGFVSRYFPGAVTWATELSKMAEATPAREKNMVYGGGVVYLTDVIKARALARDIPHTDGEDWARGLEAVAAVLPVAVKKAPRDWFAVDANFKLEPEAMRTSEVGREYAKLLERLDEAVTMRAAHLQMERDAKAQAQALAEQAARQAAADKAAQEAAEDLAAQAMYYVLDLRVNSRRVDSFSGGVTVTRDELENGRIRVEATLSEVDGVEGMLLSTDGARTWDAMPVSRDIRFEFLPAAGQRYDFYVTLKRGGTREDVTLRLLPGGPVVYENVDYNQLVLAAIRALAEAYEAQDAAAFARVISRDYLGNRVFLEEGVRFDFDMFSAIELRIYVNRITVAKGYATVETKWDKKQIPRTTGQQQATSGRTTMTFVPEDGVMKLRNLRGNLLYATLSPEIAEASGLPMTVVDEIRTARDERTPTQPGAGDVLDSGGVASASAITVRTATIEKNTAPPTRGLDFETGAQSLPASGTADLGFEGNSLWSENAATFQTVGGSFEGLVEAPEGGYGALTGDPVTTGQVYAFRTTEGNYGKFVIDSSTDLGGGLFRNVLRYAVQTNGTRNVRTQ
ncbi:hypothetical protein [Desulfocurvus sp.]|uniref:hypothetical protein n=1 Tax=Desulfocurvus sp. TaxID=2871698 RepID=UPI0025B991E1|nr:hypothetical protein [Desulfocurvus sp.]MCK9240034.1 hypothetical protein [Desulfocurvus sp.]